MAVFGRGFQGKRDSDPALPPGQYLTHDFPVLSARPTAPISREQWSFTSRPKRGAAQLDLGTVHRAAQLRTDGGHPLRHALVEAAHHLARGLAGRPARRHRHLRRLRHGTQLRRLHDKPAAGGTAPR